LQRLYRDLTGAQRLVRRAGAAMAGKRAQRGEASSSAREDTKPRKRAARSTRASYTHTSTAEPAHRANAKVVPKRPDPYKLVKKNVYGVCESLPAPKKLPKEEVDTCECTRPEEEVGPDGPQGCGPDCINRETNIICDPRTCPCGPHCSNGPFQTRRLPKMELFYTGARGWGGRACEDIPKGTYVGEYCGEIVTPEECARRMAKAKEEGDPRFYMMQLHSRAIIDAKHKGGWVRFLNSCCEPNCKAETWTDSSTGEKRVGLFTIKPVKAGQELHYDYMLEHQGSMIAAQRYRCLCGAKSCRGLMDPKAERLKNAGRRIEIEWDDGRYYRGTVVQYNSRKDEYRVQYDDGDYEDVALKTIAHRWLKSDAPECPSPPKAGDVAALSKWEAECRLYLDPRGEDSGEDSGDEGNE